jgi:hypothetical protein
MRRYLMSALLLVPLTAPGARADFVVAASRPPALAPTTAPNFAPAPGPSEASQPANAAETSPAPSLRPRFKLAQGFGDQVPLSFAVRQIVPRAVRVTYGPGADPDALVDWKGGEGWNRVLFRAVHPLGLRLVMTYMAVQIRK